MCCPAYGIWNSSFFPDGSVKIFCVIYCISEEKSRNFIPFAEKTGIKIQGMKTCMYVRYRNRDRCLFVQLTIVIAERIRYTEHIETERAGRSGQYNKEQ